MNRRGWLGWARSSLVVAALASAGCDLSAGDGGVSFGLASGKATDTWTRTYTVAAGGLVEILNINGEIRAEASTGTAVEVTASRTAQAASDDEARSVLAAVQMREEVSERKVRIEVIGPKLRLGGHGASFVVKVPAGVHVDLRTVNGGVRLDGVGGEVRASSTNGGVKGTLGAASLVDARTTNGGVDVVLAGALAADGAVRLTSVNGGVRLAVPAETRADVSARCTNGRVTTDLPLTTNGEQTRRRMSGTLNGGGARIDLQTTNGGVVLNRS